jgi:hypothetical protein
MRDDLRDTARRSRNQTSIACASFGVGAPTTEPQFWPGTRSVRPSPGGRGSGDWTFCITSKPWSTLSLSSRSHGPVGATRTPLNVEDARTSPHRSIALSLRERVGVRGRCHPHDEAKVWRWLCGRKPRTRSSSTIAERGRTSYVIEGSTDFLCRKNAVGPATQKTMIREVESDAMFLTSPSPRPSPGGRGRSSRPTWSCIFSVVGTAGCCRESLLPGRVLLTTLKPRYLLITYKLQALSRKESGGLAQVLLPRQVRWRTHL